jgi:hypothetical protein
MTILVVAVVALALFVAFAAVIWGFLWLSEPQAKQNH